MKAHIFRYAAENIGKLVLAAVTAQRTDLGAAPKVATEVTTYELAFLEDIRAGKAAVVRVGMLTRIVQDAVEYWKTLGDVPDWVKNGWDKEGEEHVNEQA